MKFRCGFVSNSSSTCFILNLKDPGVGELVKRIKEGGISPPYGLGRGTAMAIGDDAFQYAWDWSLDVDGDWGPDLGEWIRDYVGEVGIENIVFIRSSDEDMGGHLPEGELVAELAIAEIEYH